MSELVNIDKNYSAGLKEIKNKVRTVQLKAAVKVNSDILNFYWELVADIVEKQATSKGGDGFLSKLSHDLMAEFPDMRGFSKRNLELIRQGYVSTSNLLGIPQTNDPHHRIIIATDAAIDNLVGLYFSNLPLDLKGIQGYLFYTKEMPIAQQAVSQLIQVS